VTSVEISAQRRTGGAMMWQQHRQAWWRQRAFV